jgi:ribosomal protein S18 acetylase RimI-like enzyme
MDRGIVAEAWEVHHFTLDLPSKWEVSRLALFHEQPVGFMVATLKAESVHVNRIAVDPDWRGKGMGTLLLQEAASSAVTFQKSLVTLKVSQSNHAAIQFYTHLGFARQNTGDQNLSLQITAHRLLALSSSSQKKDSHA